MRYQSQGDKCPEIYIFKIKERKHLISYFLTFVKGYLSLGLNFIYLFDLLMIVNTYIYMQLPNFAIILKNIYHLGSDEEYRERGRDKLWWLNTF